MAAESSGAGPFVVAIGGTGRSESSTELALRQVLGAAEALGATTKLFGGHHLMALPHYVPEISERTQQQRELVEAVRRADGIVIGSPGYHCGVTGLVKNAIDHLEDLRDDIRPYLDGRAVGCIATAGGGQAAVMTMVAIRSIVHALRGWPTPLGVPLTTSPGGSFDRQGRCKDPLAAGQLAEVGRQIVAFARGQVSPRTETPA